MLCLEDGIGRGGLRRRGLALRVGDAVAGDYDTRLGSPVIVSRRTVPNASP